MKNFKGFTLVEILIVTAIIALLASLAVPNILRARINSNETNAQATLKTIGNAAENYFTTNSNYPTASNDLLNATPPYLGKDYFTGNFYGYTYAASWDIGGYSVLAEPTGPNQGTLSYTLSTGGIIQQN